MGSDTDLETEMRLVDKWFCSDFIKTLAKDMYIEIIRKREENRVMREALDKVSKDKASNDADYLRVSMQMNAALKEIVQLKRELKLIKVALLSAQNGA